MAAPSPSKRPTNDPLPLFFSPVTLSIHLITRRVSRPATKLTLHSLPTCSFLLMYTLSHEPLTHPSCDLSTFYPPPFSDFFLFFFQWGPHTHTRTHKRLGVPTPTPTPTPWVGTSRPRNASHTRAPRINETIQFIALWSTERQCLTSAVHQPSDLETFFGLTPYLPRTFLMFRALRLLTSVRSCRDPLAVFRVGVMWFVRCSVFREFQERGGEGNSGKSCVFGRFVGGLGASARGSVYCSPGGVRPQNR